MTAHQTGTVDQYISPNGKYVPTTTTLDSLFSDDFGGITVSPSNWDVIDGGLAAVVSGTAVSQMLSAPVPAFSQAKIGSGITGITDSVSGSALTVNMNTTNGAERWYLSQQVFAGKEDILVILSKSGYLVANSIYIGLVEVDPTTFVPLLNPNIAADSNGSSEFTNRGGVEFAATVTNTAYVAQAIGDSSSVVAAGGVGAAGSALASTQEFLIEIDTRDITVSSTTVDAVVSKASGASRVSSQCPNDKKLYKLVMRFKNTAAPGANTAVVIQRVIVADNYEQRVQISSGEGDLIGNKAVAVNIVGPTTGTSNNNNLGLVNPAPLSTNAQGAFTTHKLVAAATTNATSVKTAFGRLFGGVLSNVTSTACYVKFYNKASAPTVGTDTPVLTVALSQYAVVPIADIVGFYGQYFGTGIAYAITANAADSDTTAVAANSVIVSLTYM